MHRVPEETLQALLDLNRFHYLIIYLQINILCCDNAALNIILSTLYSLIQAQFSIFIDIFNVSHDAN